MGSQDLEIRDAGVHSAALEKGKPDVAQDAIVQATELEVKVELEKDEKHTEASFAHFIVGLRSLLILP